MASTGRPWDELEDTLTVPRLQALMEYWRINPPAHLLLRAFTGYKTPAGAVTGGGAPMSVAEFFKRMPAPPSSEGLSDLVAGLMPGVTVKPNG